MVDKESFWKEYGSLKEYEEAMSAQTAQFWKNRGIYLPDPKRVEELLKKETNEL